MRASKNYELLAPVGNMEMFDAALAGHADAVYLAGPSFGARAYADNFSLGQFNDLVRRAHINGIKVYITVNTLVKDSEMKDLYEYLKALSGTAVDALIIQDLGVYQMIRDYFPHFEIHASTQMTINSAYGAAQLEDMGFERLILARETSLDEIKRISKRTNIDLEAFIHGSLCISVSGQCLASSFIGQRSGNRGRCAQPCRKLYRILDDKKRVISYSRDSFLSARDLMTIDQLGELLDAGVKSLKIEGRMKKPEYVYTVLKEYRKALEKRSYSKDDLAYVSNRLFTKGLAFSDFGRDFFNSKDSLLGVEVGRIEKRGPKIFISFTKEVHKKDTITVENIENRRFNLTLTRNYKPGQAMDVSDFTDIKNRTRVYKIFSNQIVEDLEKEEKEKKDLYIKLDVGPARPIEASILCDGKLFEVQSSFLVQKAKNRPSSIESISDKMNRLGNTDYRLQELDISLEENSFVPASLLNDFRREIIEKIDKSYYSFKPGMIEEYRPNKREDKQRKRMGLSLEIVGPYRGYSLDKLERVYVHRLEDLEKVRNNFDGQVFYLPPKFLETPSYEDLLEKIKDKIDLIDGISIHTLSDYRAFRNLGLKLHPEMSFNVFNSRAINYLKEEISDDFSLSMELNLDEIKDLSLGKARVETIGYGKITLMNLYQCPMAIVKGCKDGKNCQNCPFSKNIFLEGDMDSFELYRADGYTEVLSEEKIDIRPILDKFTDKGLSLIRLIDRSDQQIEDTIDDFYYLIENKKTGNKGYTGHYEKGVI